MLIRVQSTAGEMRTGPREFAGGFHGKLPSKTPGQASWFPNSCSSGSAGSKRKQKERNRHRLTNLLGAAGEGAEGRAEAQALDADLEGGATAVEEVLQK